MLTQYKNKNFPTVFERFFDDEFFKFDLPKVSTPETNVIENENDFVVETVLAGIDKDNVKLRVENGVLSIEAERKEENKSKYNRKEMFFGKLQRSFTLPDNVDIENVDAKFENGILKVVLPKTVSVDSSKLIEIK
jgi:HSP20 family protein